MIEFISMCDDVTTRSFVTIIDDQTVTCVIGMIVY